MPRDARSYKRHGHKQIKCCTINSAGFWKRVALMNLLKGSFRLFGLYNNSCYESRRGRRQRRRYARSRPSSTRGIMFATLLECWTPGGESLDQGDSLSQLNAAPICQICARKEGLRVRKHYAERETGFAVVCWKKRHVNEAKETHMRDALSFRNDQSEDMGQHWLQAAT